MVMILALVTCAILILSLIMLTTPQFYLLLMVIALSVVILGLSYFAIFSLNQDVDAGEP